MAGKFTTLKTYTLPGPLFGFSGTYGRVPVIQWDLQIPVELNYQLPVGGPDDTVELEVD